MPRNGGQYRRNNQYIQLTVMNKGKIPAGSPGAGRLAWMFVDEVVVE
jgi:hypothetical protein